MLNEFDVLLDVARRLTEAGIAYMLTGSLVNYYSLPRMTRDIDLVVGIQLRDIDVIVSVLEPDYYLDRDAISRAITYERAFNIIHSEAFIKVDCIVKKRSEYRQVEFDRRQQVDFQGSEVWLVSKEDLIISKLYWARDSHSELQLRDVKNLLASGYDVSILNGGPRSSDYMSCSRNAKVTDTEPEVARKFYEMIMTRSGEERFMMGIRSFEAARAIVLASLPRNLPERELKHRLFERFYGASVDEILRGAACSLEHTNETGP